MKFDKIIVIDLEFTCGLPEGQEPEIIEIGVAEINNKDCVRWHSSILVRPEKTKITPCCTELTGWTWDGLRKTAMPLESALNKLMKEHGTRSHFVGAYGDDCEYIAKICAERGIKNPLKETVNISNLFQMKYRKKLSLKEAIESLDLRFYGREHNGMDDAYNAARLLEKIL